MLNLHSAIFMFCNSAFEDLRHYIHNALLLLLSLLVLLLLQLLLLLLLLILLL